MFSHLFLSFMSTMTVALTVLVCVKNLVKYWQRYNNIHMYSVDLCLQLAFPSSYHTVLSTNVLALDTLLAFLSALKSSDSSEVNQPTELKIPSFNQQNEEPDANKTHTSNSNIRVYGLKKKGEIISPGTPSELLKARQLKKVLLIV